ncbi:MAG: IS5 family transposase [bacterium]|nr:IS5 family transposase [bacterium]
MESLVNFALKEKYAKVKKLRSRLENMDKIIDWNKFLALFPERESTVGRPNYNKILLLKILFLQGWYGLSDEELEFQINDRFSFQQFLGFPNFIPDYSTIWRFREELADGNLTDKIWNELQRQINEKNISVEKGVIQDAVFIIAEPGKTNSGMNDRGQSAKTSRNRDGSWTKKGKKSFFGYKAHTKMRRGSKIIESLAVTTARVPDGKIDLAIPNDIIYRDKGYTGTKTKAKGDGTMRRGNLSVDEILRNKRIQSKRSQGEHPYATIKRAMHGGQTKLTTVYRVFVQQLFVFAAYNIYRLATIVRT